MDYKTLINNNIKRIRKELNLTREEFAEKAGVSADTIGNLESNRYAPTPKTINKICDAFDIIPMNLLAPALTDNKRDVLNTIMSILEFFDLNDLYHVHEILTHIYKIKSKSND